MRSSGFGPRHGKLKETISLSLVDAVPWTFTPHIPQGLNATVSVPVFMSDWCHPDTNQLAAAWKAFLRDVAQVNGEHWGTRRALCRFTFCNRGSGPAQRLRSSRPGGFLGQFANSILAAALQRMISVGSADRPAASACSADRARLAVGSHQSFAASRSIRLQIRDQQIPRGFQVGFRQHFRHRVNIPRPDNDPDRPRA